MGDSALFPAVFRTEIGRCPPFGETKRRKSHFRRRVPENDRINNTTTSFPGTWYIKSDVQRFRVSDDEKLVEKPEGCLISYPFNTAIFG